MSTNYSFGRLSDTAILSFAKAVTSEFNDAVATLYYGENSLFQIDKNAQNSPANLKKIFTPSSYLLYSFKINIPSLTVSMRYYRAQLFQTVNGNPGWHPGPPFVDGLAVTGPTSPSDDFARLLPIITKHIQMAPPLGAVDDKSSAMDQAASVLNAMTDAVNTLVQHTAERQRDLDLTRVDWEKKSIEEIESVKSTLRKLNEAREIELEKKSTVLDQRAAQIDDRANTHVRRELQRDMAKLADDRLSGRLMGQSALTFLIPLILTVLAASVLGLVIFTEINAIDSVGQGISSIMENSMIGAETKAALIQNLNSQALYGQLRVGLQGLGLAALIWFALRLTSARYRQVSRWERELHKFRLDTERAGFLVEGDLEARKVNEQGLPDVLLQSFSKGLFASSEGEHVETPQEEIGSALTALLGQAAKFQIGPSGMSAEVDRKGIQRADRVLRGGATAES